MVLNVHPVTPQGRHIARAVEVLRSGGVIIYPTDTVYGIGCSVFDTAAIRRVYQIKRQSEQKPFSFLCSDLSHISEYARVSNAAFRTMKHLIPGPYTFLLPAARLKQLPKSLLSKRKTVGIRVPDNLVCRMLVEQLGHPILSAGVTDADGNIVQHPDDIRDLFEDQVDLILACEPSLLELSTIVDFTEDQPVVVRQGAGDTSMFQTG